MNIEKVIQEDRQAKLTVEYTPEEFEGLKRRAAKKISSSTKIPGFRPGKVPYQVIVNRYGEEAIVQEAIDLLLENDYSKILEEAEIEPSGAGNLDTIESYDPPKLIFYVPLEPEIDLGNYRDLRVPFEPEDFDVSEVDRYIMNLRRNSATIIPADRPAETEDLVYFNLSGEFLNPGEDEDTTITENSPQQVVIPNEEDTSTKEWPYPGFARSLLGVKSGELKEIQHTYPDDYPDKEYRGKTAIFTVDVQSVKALELHELDETFLQGMGDYETPEDFREALEEQMRADSNENYEQEYFNKILNEIIENASINYPPQMLEHEEEHVLDDIKSRLEKQNLEFETFLKLRDTEEETFMAEEVKPNAKQRLERSLILNALLDAEKMKLDQELLSQAINSIMAEVFQSGNLEEMKKQMGNESFSRAISMEGYTRTINTQLRNRLKLIGTGQPIPEEDETGKAEEESVEIEVDVSVQLQAEAGKQEIAADIDTSDHDVVDPDYETEQNAENNDELEQVAKDQVDDQNEELVEWPDESEENEPGEESNQETESVNNQ